MTATARPPALDVNPDGIPAALRARPQWVGWEYEWRGGKWTKTPLDIRTGALASSTDPATWATFEAALRAFAGRGYAGIGFVFAADDPFVGVDIDHCLDDAGRPDTAGGTIVMEIGSYTEVTPGGHGLHIIAVAGLPGGKGRKSIKHGIEIYDRARFFTITGRTLDGSPREPQPRQPELDDLYARLFPVRPVEDVPPRPGGGAPPPDDQILIDRAHRAKNGSAFARLWRGDTGGHHDDDSSADLALCNHLAFWAGPDPARIDRLFRQSGLYRTKWEREGYRDATIGRALAGRTEFYGWPGRAGGEDDGASFDPGEDVPPDGAGAAPDGSANPNDYDLTDTGNARLYAALYAGELRHDHRRALWLRWGGHWWAQDDDGHAMRLTETVATLRLRAAAEIEDKDERKHALRWAMLSQGRARREACLSIATTTKPLAVAGATWDRDPFLLGVANGVVDLTTGALHPGAPSDEITMHSAVAYDAAARAPRWERFLREVFREDAGLIRWVQRFAGYSLTGDISEHALVLCFGTGSNGKSTFLNALAAIMGDYTYTTPFSVLERSDRDNGASNDLAALVGRRLVTANETNEGRQFNEARIKALTGGDPITARFLHKEFFTFRPVLKLWLAVNHKPVVRDDSRGFWRRFRMLPFLASFDGEQADKHLDRALAAEAPGILAWAVRGCLDWRRDGLETPPIVAEATAEYERESDPLGPFIAQCCAESGALAIRASEFYQAYTEWAAEQGLQGREVLSRTLFGRRMGDRFKKTEDRQGTLYRGVGLSDEWRERKHGARFTP